MPNATTLSSTATTTQPESVALHHLTQLSAVSSANSGVQQQQQQQQPLDAYNTWGQHFWPGSLVYGGTTAATTVNLQMLPQHQTGNIFTDNNLDHLTGQTSLLHRSNAASSNNLSGCLDMSHLMPSQHHHNHNLSLSSGLLQSPHTHQTLGTLVLGGSTQQPSASSSNSAAQHTLLQHQQLPLHVSLSGTGNSNSTGELEQFAERFKQRRIKLGVTQADVGNALGKLNIAGVGPLSQSTICRFESLTLSHNNMVALKPVLETWLRQAESQMAAQQAAGMRMDGSVPDLHSTDMMNRLQRSLAENGLMRMDDASMRRTGSSGQRSALVMSSPSDEASSSLQPPPFNDVLGSKKRKRTSIASPEKRSLEAYFKHQPRPTGDKIAQIAEKLELKKNVVRVWFCNQRQKQKRMKFRQQEGGQNQLNID